MWREVRDAAVAVLNNLNRGRFVRANSDWRLHGPEIPKAGLRPGVTAHGFRSSFRDWAAEPDPPPEAVAKPDTASPSSAHDPFPPPVPGTVPRTPPPQKDGTQALFNGTEASQAGPKKPVCLTLNF